MLGTLLESNARPRPRSAGTAASIAIHAGVIMGAIAATASAEPEARTLEAELRRRPVFVTHVRTAEPRPSRTSTRQATTVRPAKRLGPLDDLTIQYESKAGPIPLGELDPNSMLAFDTLGPARRFWPTGGGRLGPELGNQPATATTVDKAAALLSPPRPRYPDQLRAAGVTGRVVVRLVVDTAGRVEPASIVVRESSHDLFANAVRAVLAGLRFAPAEAGGRKVRMLVDLPFEFRLD
jgi:periplasmic protein TonB